MATWNYDDVQLPTITRESGLGDDVDNIVICEVCKQTLDQFTTPDGVDAWIHGSTWKVFDHVPVPRLVPVTAAPSTQCDFCGTVGKLVWQLIGDRLAMGTPDGTRKFDAGWGVCGVCAPMLLENRLDELMDRVTGMNKFAYADSPEQAVIVRRQLRKMWDTFLPTVHTKVYLGGKRKPANLNPRMMPKLQQGVAKFWSHPNVRRLIGQGRADRDTMRTFPGVHCGDENRFVSGFSARASVPESVITSHCDHLVAGIWTSELYWISENFTKLSAMAGQDFDEVTLTRDQLPNPFGFMMFASAIGQIPRPAGMADIRGVSWTLVPQGVWMNLYVQGEDADPEADVEAMRSEFGYLICTNSGSGLRFDEKFSMRDAPEEITILRTIFAAWFLLNQPGVADIEKAPVDKKYARSYQRANGRPLPDVKLVDLRKQPRRSTGTGTHVGRPLKERIFRSGHWKEQAWGPKRGMRRTIYVSAYIAGPDGAPLRQRPTTVKVLR